MFLVQLIVSSFLDLISKQARRNAVFLFSILFYNYFGALNTRRLIEDGCLIGGHLMEVQLYTEWDDNHVCIINQWKGWDETATWWVLSRKNSSAIWKIIDNTG